MGSDELARVLRDGARAAAPRAAFELFTTWMGAFWPSEHSIGSATIAGVVIEPYAGVAGLNVTSTAPSGPAP